MQPSSVRIFKQILRGYLILLGSLSLLMPYSAHAGSAALKVTSPTQSVITQTFQKSGGAGALGAAAGETGSWGTSCEQDYTGGRAGSAAIIVTNCEALMEVGQGAAAVVPAAAKMIGSDPKPKSVSSFVVRGEFWQYAQALGSSALGSPVGNDQLLGDGRWQTFGQESSGQPVLTDLFQAPGSTSVYSTRGQIRSAYQETGAVSGRFGWPVSEQYDWQGEQRQDFQFGSLVWRAETGARTLVSWSSGQVLASPTADPAQFLVREANSYKIASSVQLNRCYGGSAAVKNISADDLSLTIKKYTPAGAAPECVTPAEQTAINWAMVQLKTSWSSQLGSYWSGQCEAFVELAFGTIHRADSAMANYLWRKNRGEIHTDASAPAGAMVFYGGSSDGHAGISLGNGVVISTQGYNGDRLPVWQHKITGLGNPYLGWAYVNGNWPR